MNLDYFCLCCTADSPLVRQAVTYIKYVPVRRQSERCINVKVILSSMESKGVMKINASTRK